MKNGWIVKSIEKEEGRMRERKKEEIEVRALLLKCGGAGRGVTTGTADEWCVFISQVCGQA